MYILSTDHDIHSDKTTCLKCSHGANEPSLLCQKMFLAQFQNVQNVNISALNALPKKRLSNHAYKLLIFETGRFPNAQSWSLLRYTSVLFRRDIKLICLSPPLHSPPPPNIPISLMPCLCFFILFSFPLYIQWNIHRHKLC